MMMKGMSSSIRGAGMYHTTIVRCPLSRCTAPIISSFDGSCAWVFSQGSHENASFYAESAGQHAKYSLLYAYRVGGPPTYIEDLCISGPSNYQASFHNLVGIRMENTNGFYFKGVWFTAYEAGCVV